MAETVKLSLVGTQRDETGEETVAQTSTYAEYYEKNGLLYLLYEETQEDSGAVVKNILKLNGSVLELTRRGSPGTHMVFEAGREHPADYATPYGRLKLEMRTHTLEVFFRQGLPQIQVDYSLMSEGLPLSECTLVITVESLSTAHSVLNSFLR